MTENFKQFNISPENNGKDEAEKKIKISSSNPKNAVDYKTGFIEYHEKKAEEERQRIEKIMKANEKIKEETDKLLNKEKK